MTCEQKKKKKGKKNPLLETMKVLSLLLCSLTFVFALDIGPQLIQAVDQISGTTDNPTIDRLAQELMAQLRRAGVSDTRWVHEMLYQKRGAHLQVANDRQLFVARVAKGVRLGVIGVNGRRILLARVGAAAGSEQSGGGVQPRVVEGPSSVREVQALMARVVRPGYSSLNVIDEVTAAMRRAGFRDNAIQTAIALMRMQSRLATAGTGQNLYGGVGGLDTYRSDQSEFNRLAGVAANQGIIPLATQRAISAFTGEQLQTWRQKTREEIDQNNRDRVSKNGDLIRRANALLNEIKELRQYVDSKNGFVQTGLGDASVIVRLIGGVSARGHLDGAGGALNYALNMPDVNYQKVDKVQEAYRVAWGYITQLRPRGANTVEYLRNKREEGYALLGQASTVAGFVPVIGKPLSIALTNLEGGMRYLSGDISGAEALAKSLSSLVGGTLGKKIVGTGSIVSQSMRSAVQSFSSSLTVDLAKILSNPRLTGDQRDEQIRLAVGRAVVGAFNSGVSKSISGGIAMNDDAARAEMYEQFKSIGEKFGLEPFVMKPILAQLQPRN